jgi:hypothetical protein
MPITHKYITSKAAIFFQQIIALQDDQALVLHRQYSCDNFYNLPSMRMSRKTSTFNAIKVLDLEEKLISITVNTLTTKLLHQLLIILTPS